LLNIFNEIYKQLYIIYNSIKNEIILKSNIIYYLLFIIYYLLFIIYYLLFIIYYLFIKIILIKKKKHSINKTYNQFNYV